MQIDIDDHFYLLNHEKGDGWKEVICWECDWSTTGYEKICEEAAYDHWDREHSRDELRDPVMTPEQKIEAIRSELDTYIRFLNISLQDSKDESWAKDHAWEYTNLEKIVEILDA